MRRRRANPRDGSVGGEEGPQSRNHQEPRRESTAAGEESVHVGGGGSGCSGDDWDVEQSVNC